MKNTTLAAPRPAPRRRGAGEWIQSTTSDTFAKLVLEGEGPIAVEFMSYGCAHCQIIEPVLQQVAAMVKSIEKVFRVNIAVEPELAERWYANEVLANGRGVLIPFDDSAAIVDSVTELLDNESALQTMRKCAYLYARGMVWDQISKSYIQSFVRAGASHPRPAREAFLPTIAAQNGSGRILGA